MNKYMNIKLTVREANALKQYIDSPSMDDLPNKDWVDMLDTISLKIEKSMTKQRLVVDNGDRATRR